MVILFISNLLLIYTLSRFQYTTVFLKMNSPVGNMQKASKLKKINNLFMMCSWLSCIVLLWYNSHSDDIPFVWMNLTLWGQEYKIRNLSDILTIQSSLFFILERRYDEVRAEFSQGTEFCTIRYLICPTVHVHCQGRENDELYVRLSESI
jgi:hypothetical protein